MSEKLELTYGENSRRREALQLLETVVEANTRTKGEEHPDSLQSMHDLITMKENPNLLTESSRRHLESKKIPQLKLQIIREQNSIRVWVDRGRNVFNQICVFIQQGSPVSASTSILPMSDKALVFVSIR
jgi:hypothetical protein